MLVRLPIAEPARYYDATRTIIVRSGLLIEEERRYLWHELAHADRGDRDCDTDRAAERIVERHAAENAMPWLSLRWAWDQAVDLTDMADLLKLPEKWVHFRLMCLHPALKAQLRVTAPAWA